MSTSVPDVVDAPHDSEVLSWLPPALAGVSDAPQPLDDVSGAPQPLDDVSGAPQPLDDVAGAPHPLDAVSGAPHTLDDVSGAPHPPAEVSGAPQPSEEALDSDTLPPHPPSIPRPAPAPGPPIPRPFPRPRPRVGPTLSLNGWCVCVSPNYACGLITRTHRIVYVRPAQRRRRAVPLDLARMYEIALAEAFTAPCYRGPILLVELQAQTSAEWAVGCTSSMLTMQRANGMISCLTTADTVTCSFVCPEESRQDE
ncbi:hypothetical protein B0H21DRAFT_2293 [Amylocystis lapponica]|nr:hypothetical protein B0H21DRAFT_2293 [Amylocystis lapponica]